MRVMELLAPPHSHILSAAEGWLELGNLVEAQAELTRMEEPLQNHPQVLSVRWAICAQEKNWPAALELARQLVQLVPESPFGWLHQAYALRRVADGGLQAAWDALLPALEKFPQLALIPYNLACYACQLQQLEKARELLQRALKTGEKQQIKRIALEDPDLQPLWIEIREL